MVPRDRLLAYCGDRELTRPRLGAYVPLLRHVVPTLIIGYGFVISASCIAGVNELTIGFGASVAGTCVACAVGVRTARRTAERRTHAPS